MKTIIMLVLMSQSLLLISCSSAPKPRGFELPPALSEVYRNGQLKGLEQADSEDLGLPNPNDRIPRTCRSQPIYSLEGYYIRTDVRCR